MEKDQENEEIEFLRERDDIEEEAVVETQQEDEMAKQREDFS